MNSFAYNSTFSFNYIFIFDCLPADDLQTARHLFEEMQDYNLQNPKKMPCFEMIKIKSAANFFAATSAIRRMCKNGLMPIIHIESHGDEEKGIFVGDTKEMIGWEIFVSEMRGINVIAKNNLGVIMASCNGFHSVSYISVAEPCPFYFLIGSSARVEAGIIRDNMIIFYKELFESKNLRTAFYKLRKNFVLFHAESIFCESYGVFYKKIISAKGRERRVEELLTEAIKRKKAAGQNYDISKIRKELKNKVRQPKINFDRMVDIYLHGKRRIDFETFHDYFMSRNSS